MSDKAKTTKRPQYKAGDLILVRLDEADAHDLTGGHSTRITECTIPRDRVHLAIDDRNRVVKAWREAGVPCLQVAEGAF